MGFGMSSLPPPPPPVAFPQPGPPPGLPELPEGLPPQPHWPPWTAPVALIAAFVVAVFGAILIGAVAAAGGASLQHPPPSVEILATAFQDAALIGSALLFARITRRPRPWHFGLRATRFWPALGWMALAWVSFIVFSAVWVTALDIKSKDRLPDELGADQSTVALLAVAVLVCVIAPIAEEVFFRGYFFNALRSWKGLWPAAILTGLVFGAIHVGSAPGPLPVPPAGLGVVLGPPFLRPGGLYPGL